MTGYRPQAPLFISAGHLKAIGNLVIYWGWLEITVQVGIWRLLGLTQERGAMLTSHIGLISLISILKMLTDDRYGEGSPRSRNLKAILDQIEPLRIERNSIVHSLWYHTTRPRRALPAKSLKISAKGKLKMETKGRTESDIQEITTRIWEVTHELREFVQAKFPKPRYASPPKLQKPALAQKRGRRKAPPKPNRDTRPHPPEASPG
jgi:hypothetical protein